MPDAAAILRPSIASPPSPPIPDSRRWRAPTRWATCDRSPIRAPNARSSTPQVAITRRFVPPRYWGWAIQDSRRRSRPILVRALSDPSRIVRVGAALSLMNRKITRLDGPAAQPFERAKQDYLTRSVLLADDARIQLDTGKFHLLDQNASAAAAALEAAMRIDDGLPSVRYFLAVARLAQGRKADAIVLLGQIPATDPQAAAAAALLDVLKR